jgi:N-acetyl-anhydromuramyl-L-alanine amidase AmpD
VISVTVSLQNNGHIPSHVAGGKFVTDYMISEADRHSKAEVGGNLKWCPLAQIVTPHMPTQGAYPDGYPRGAVVHFTAGRDDNEQHAANMVSWGREQGYCYFVIGPSGIIYQSFPLDRWGHHAGESAWPGLGSSVSSKLVGIEVCCAGKLDDKNQSWFGVTYPSSEVRKVTESKHGCPTGFYRKFTAEQEQSLKQLLIWLKQNNPAVFSFDLVLGHHEVSGMKGIGHWRKNDPGGSLSMPMDILRDDIRRSS